jgi:hypothetical protein
MRPKTHVRKQNVLAISKSLSTGLARWFSTGSPPIAAARQIRPEERARTVIGALD